MTRLRNRGSKREKDAESGSTRPNASARGPYSNSGDFTAPTTPKADFVGAVLSENWKQQAMVKKNNNHQVLTSMMLTMQVLAATGLIMFASAQVSLHYPLR